MSALFVLPGGRVQSHLGQVSHPLLLNECAVAGQSFHNALDDLVKQALQLLNRRRPHTTKIQRVVLDAIDAIEHQAVQMNIEISG